MYLSATADTMKAAWRRLRKPVLKPRRLPPLARYYSHFPPSKNSPWSHSTFFLLLCFKFLIILALSCWSHHNRRFCVCVWSSRPGIPVPPPPSAPSWSAGEGSWGGKLWRRQVLAPLQSFVCSPPQLRSSVYLRTNTPLSCSTEERPHVKFWTRRKGRSVTIHKLPVSKAHVNLGVEELV